MTSLLSITGNPCSHLVVVVGISRLDEMPFRYKFEAPTILASDMGGELLDVELAPPSRDALYRGRYPR